MYEDISVLNKFLQICDLIKPEMSIEVGAFDAVFSQQVNAPEKYAYEANPYVYEHFYPLPNINYINMAISDYDGSALIGIESLQEPIQGHYSIKGRTDRQIDPNNLLGTSCARLDTLHKTDKTIALWIDCEGANREVLLGAENLLNTVACIVIETEHFPFWEDQWLHEDVLKYIRSKGFKLFLYTPYGENQANCIFVHNKYWDLVCTAQI